MKITTGVKKGIKEGNQIMKQIIRYNTFETNSSSMHSLVVAKNPRPYNKRELALNCYSPDRSYELFFCYNEEGADFNRYPFQVLRDPADKLRYYVAHEIGTCEKKNLIPKVKKFISKQTGVPVKKIEIGITNRWSHTNKAKRDYYGFVEHNDTGESPFDYINRKGITMEELVLNPKYIIIVDGDEYCEFKKLFESNLLNANDFEDISSGANFWNEPFFHISISWLANKENTIEDIIDGIDWTTKAVCIRMDKNDIETYNANIAKLKALKPAALALAAPGAKFILQNYYYAEPEYKLSKEDFDNLADTSFFDEICVDATKYDEDCIVD